MSIPIENLDAVVYKEIYPDMSPERAALFVGKDGANNIGRWLCTICGKITEMKIDIPSDTPNNCSHCGTRFDWKQTSMVAYLRSPIP